MATFLDAANAAWLGASRAESTAHSAVITALDLADRLDNEASPDAELAASLAELAYAAHQAAKAVEAALFTAVTS